MSRIHLLIPTCIVKNSFKSISSLTRTLESSGRRATVVVLVNSKFDTMRVAHATGSIVQVRTVLIPDRIGYVRACNMAYTISESEPDDLVVVANDDVTANGDWISPLVEAIEGGAAQAGPSVHHVGMDGYWGDGSERYQYAEGWLWMSRDRTIRDAGGLYDPAFSPGYCEDMDLSIRIQQRGGKICQVAVPVEHLRSQTFGEDREPFWGENRRRLVEKWGLASCANN